MGEKGPGYTVCSSCLGDLLLGDLGPVASCMKANVLMVEGHASLLLLPCHTAAL